MSIFIRNFTAYFLNPTGYVFICVFVLLSSIAAFLPDDFVNTNLANLDQLNRWFPLIMLVFIPAITMGIWADERRFGTEELLLTMPISTARIVLGKYFAALGIYSISLLFSLLTNFIILRFLGQPDAGLFLTTGLGYWLLGAAMLAIGMSASFLTSQLTVAYILAGLFNTPLIALQWADAAPVSHSMAVFLKNLGLAAKFEPFGRGIIGLAPTLYFILIPAVMLWLCLVILNRRYRPAGSIAGFIHTPIRFMSLVVAAFVLVQMAAVPDWKFDATEERLSTLSQESILLIERQKTKYPIVIEAYLSPELPQEFVRTKLDIISVLDAIRSISPNSVFLDFRETLPNTKDAYRLERLYDIKPQKVVFDVRGRAREESIFLTIIFRSGPRTVTIPFLNRGLSVEYELVNALLGIGEREKKRIGILRTAAGLLGRYNQRGELVAGAWPIVDELEKQYTVLDIDPEKPIELKKCDVLLAVQPSSLTVAGMLHFANLLRQGQPTVVFEDPFPIFADYIPKTKLPTGPNARYIPPEMRGDIGLVWAMLGVTFSTDILWKNYNPYPKLAALSEEYLFVDNNPIKLDLTKLDTKSNTKSNDPANNTKSSGSDSRNQVAPKKQSDTKNQKNRFKQREEEAVAFSPDDRTTARLEHILFPFCGSIAKAVNAETDFMPLIRTRAGGFTPPEEILHRGIRTYSSKRTDRDTVYTLAARITGTVPNAFAMSAEETKNRPAFNVVLVSDLDLLTPGFFRIREMGTDVRNGVTLDFDNVNFVLNAIDSTADAVELIAVRTRRPKHRTLTRIEETTGRLRDRAIAEQIALTKEFESYCRKEETLLQKKVMELANKRPDKSKKISRQESMELEAAGIAARNRLTRILEEKKRINDKKIEETQREVDEFVRKVQGRYKLCAIALPPIPPLLIGGFVYLRRRRRMLTFHR